MEHSSPYIRGDDIPLSCPVTMYDGLVHGAPLDHGHNKAATVHIQAESGNGKRLCRVMHSCLGGVHVGLGCTLAPPYLDIGTLWKSESFLPVCCPQPIPDTRTYIRVMTEEATLLFLLDRSILREHKKK